MKPFLYSWTAPYVKILAGRPPRVRTKNKANACQHKHPFCVFDGWRNQDAKNDACD